jgi:hypothetical protein
MHLMWKVMNEDVVKLGIPLINIQCLDLLINHQSNNTLNSIASFRAR